MKQFRGSHIALFVAVIVMLILYINNALSNELFYVFIAIIIFLIFLGTMEKRKISLQEAKIKAFDYIISEQGKGYIKDGTVRVGEARLKDVVLKTPTNPIKQPDRYIVEILVEPSKSYLVEVSIYGNILGCGEIKLPASFSVYDIKDTEIEAGLKRIDDDVEPEESEGGD